MNKIKTNLPNGVWVIANGVAMEVERWEYGYESMADAKQSVLIEYQGRTTLVGCSNDDKVIVDLAAVFANT